MKLKTKRKLFATPSLLKEFERLTMLNFLLLHNCKESTLDLRLQKPEKNCLGKRAQNIEMIVSQNKESLNSLAKLTLWQKVHCVLKSTDKIFHIIFNLGNFYCLKILRPEIQTIERKQYRHFCRSINSSMFSFFPSLVATLSSLFLVIC